MPRSVGARYPPAQFRSALTASQTLFTVYAVVILGPLLLKQVSVRLGTGFPAGLTDRNVRPTFFSTARW